MDCDNTFLNTAKSSYSASQFGDGDVKSTKNRISISNIDEKINEFAMEGACKKLDPLVPASDLVSQNNSVHEFEYKKKIGEENHREERNEMNGDSDLWETSTKVDELVVNTGYLLDTDDLDTDDLFDLVPDDIDGLADGLRNMEILASKTEKVELDAEALKHEEDNLDSLDRNHNEIEKEKTELETVQSFNRAKIEEIQNRIEKIGIQNLRPVKFINDKIVELDLEKSELKDFNDIFYYNSSNNQFEVPAHMKDKFKENQGFTFIGLDGTRAVVMPAKINILSEADSKVFAEVFVRQYLVHIGASRRQVENAKREEKKADAGDSSIRFKDSTKREAVKPENDKNESASLSKSRSKIDKKVMSETRKQMKNDFETYIEDMNQKYDKIKQLHRSEDIERDLKMEETHIQELCNMFLGDGFEEVPEVVVKQMVELLKKYVDQVIPRYMENVGKNKIFGEHFKRVEKICLETYQILVQNAGVDRTNTSRLQSKVM